MPVRLEACGCVCIAWRRCGMCAALLGRAAAAWCATCVRIRAVHPWRSELQLKCMLGVFCTLCASRLMAMLVQARGRDEAEWQHARGLGGCEAVMRRRSEAVKAACADAMSHAACGMRAHDSRLVEKPAAFLCGAM